MTAADKLRALEAEIRVIDAGFHEAKIIDALPELIAVVEGYDEAMRWLSCLSGTRFWPADQEAVLRDAENRIAALNEKLGGET